jgi:AmmeMemoRadiSam system protein A
MPDQFLNDEERTTLLQLARQSLEDGVLGKTPRPFDLDSLSAPLRETGASFVTLTIHGQLRGCIGTLDAYQPLAEDVCTHAVDAALHDYRFPPVQPNELALIDIEVSRLTKPTPLAYKDGNELLHILRPGVDGVILRDGHHKSTFLPQVWEKLADPDVFLDHLCEKMGAPANLWRRKHLDVSIYQVEEFHENRPGSSRH